MSISKVISNLFFLSYKFSASLQSSSGKYYFFNSAKSVPPVYKEKEICWDQIINSHQFKKK